MEKNEPIVKGKGVIIGIQKQKGYGFIQQEDDTTIFFHSSGVCRPSFDDLREGNNVEYMIIQTAKGSKAIGGEMGM